jgi:hypothetical protein
MSCFRLLVQISWSLQAPWASGEASETSWTPDTNEFQGRAPSEWRGEESEAIWTARDGIQVSELESQ